MFCQLVMRFHPLPSTPISRFTWLKYSMNRKNTQIRPAHNEGLSQKGITQDQNGAIIGDKEYKSWHAGSDSADGFASATSADDRVIGFLSPSQYRAPCPYAVKEGKWKECVIHVPMELMPRSSDNSPGVSSRWLGGEQPLRSLTSDRKQFRAQFYHL